MTLVRVADTRDAVKRIAPFFFDYPSRKLRMIGITGTNGKTTTTYLLKSILNRAGYQVGVIGTIQNLIGERKVPGERRAILMTRALDGWTDLDSLLEQWSQLTAGQQQAILQACGQLARRLHAVRQVHGCFYPKHIFLQPDGAAYRAQLIDLEKTRPLLLGQRDRVKDIEPLLRRAHAWTEADVRALLAAYLEQPADSGLVDAWYQRLNVRRSHKETR